MKPCLFKLRAQLRDFDTSEVTTSADSYRERGMEAKAASILAVEDHLRDLGQQRKTMEATILAEWKKRDPEGYAAKQPIAQPSIAPKAADKMEGRLGEPETGAPEKSTATAADKMDAEKAGPTPDGAQPAAKTERIEDSGQVLEGARKLYAKAYAAKLDEGMGMDTAVVPLSKSWPEPDYQRMLDDGADPWAVAMTHALRDEVPTKPSQLAWKLKAWVTKVEALRDMAAKVTSGALTKEKFKATGGQFNLADWFNKIDLYEAVGHAESLKGVTFSKGEYGMYAGQTFNPPKTLWAITEPSKSASATWSHGNWGNELAIADTKEEAIAKFKEYKAKQVDKPATESKGTVFDIYSYKSKPGFIVGKRLSARKSIDLKTFDTVKEAREYKANNQAELEKMLEEAKVEPSERRESNSPRVGADHRMGADVTTEQFRETFGFRGEQFGASMPQGERQSNLNQAYDALMDLAGVIGVPPKALSLNGELGLAFGARGTGGLHPAAAHYERDTTGAVTPNRVVINLTRKNGAGSLAHEWFHGVDNYFARMRGEKAGMLTEKPYELMNKGVRPEMLAAFKSLMQTIEASGIKERSKQLDKKRVKDYWSTGLEMAARSFESYVIAKLQDQGASNDYLANIVPEEMYGQQANYPYPKMGEIAPIRAAFDGFFDTAQTKETDKGVAMFSRGLPSNPTTVTALQQSVREFTGTFLKNSLGRVVATTAAEIKSTWEPLIDKSVNIGSEGDAGVAQAFYDGKTKTVFLIADHIAAGNETAVLAHELMHKHGQAVLGKEGWDRLHGVINTWKDAPAGSEERTIYQFARNKVEAVGLELSSQEFFPYAVEAAIRMGIKPSMAAKKGTVAYWLESVRQNMRMVWGKITGKPETFKAQDLVNLAFGIAQRENPENASISIGAVDQNQTDTAAFKAWFGSSAVVDKDGKPLVVYHGTDSQFSTFEIEKDENSEGGAFFTTNQGAAENYGERVVAVYLSIQNPYRISGRDWKTRKVLSVHAARAKGHDGYVIENHEDDDGEIGTTYIAFNPTQIKSATGNNGNFDQTNPDIRFSRSRLGLASVPGGYADDVVVRTINDKLAGTGNSVTLVSSFADLPKRVKDAVDDPQGLKGLAYGRGEVFVIQDEIHSRQELEAVIIHELYGHVGIRSLFGPETYSRLNKLALSLGDAKIAELIKKYKLDENGYVEYAKQFEANAKMTRRAGGTEEMRRGWLMEEALAHIAEHETGTLKQLALEVVGQIRAWLRDHGFLELSSMGMSDIANILKLSRQAAFSGPGVFDVPMFSRTAANGGRVDNDAPTKPMSSAWRDGTNRLQFAPGAWLYDKLGNMAHPLLVKLQMSQASPELKRQIRQMKLEVQKAQDTAVAVANEANKLSTAERRMVSDIIEKELASGIVPPSHAVRLAATMSAAMTQQSEELVRLGMLSQEAAQRWEGAYLPRFYESKLTSKVKDAWADAMSMLRSRPRAMQGIKGRSLKGRGLYETVPVADLQQYQTMGWEVRDPDFDARKDKEVQVWRDYTRAERDKMGEIRDAGFRFVMGYMQTQKDVALGRMFEGMASTIASRLDKQGYVRVPDTKVQGTGASRYGRLSGLYVPLEVMTHLSQVEESANESLQMYRKAMSLWKEGKTVLNPVSHANNIVSNLSMAHFGGVSYHRGDKYLAAMKDFATKAPALLEAREAGLFLGSMSEVELMNTLPPELRALAKQADSTAARGAKWVYNAMNYFLRRPMGAAYSAEDTFFRYLLYKDARGRGMERNDAVDYAQRYIFTYDDLPKGARMIRDFGIPFFAYTYKAAPALLHTALTYPHRFAAPAAVLWAANAAAYAIAAGDDDDWMESLQRYLTDAEFRAKVRENEDMERENLPPWMKGTTALMSPKAIRLGMDEVTKLPMFLDVSRLVPGGDVFDVSPNAGGLPIPQPITPSNPLFTTLVAMIGNKDLFFGKEITDSNDTQGEATEKRAKWMWQQVMPAIAAGNYHWDRTMNAIAQASGGEIKWLPDSISEKYTGIGRDGLPVQPKLAAVQTFGIKMRPIDLVMSAEISESQQDAMIGKIDAEMRSLERLNNIGAVSDRVYDKAEELSWTKKDRIEDGLTVDGKSR